MSIQDERVLRDSLSGLLDGVEPAPPPVGAVMRTGKAIRTRRRLGIAGGLAAIVAAAVLVPTLVHQLRPTPATHQRNYHVSVHQPGKNDPANLVAYGSADGWHWKATAAGPRRDLTVDFSGIPNSSEMGGPLTAPGLTTSGTWPVAFEGTGGGTKANGVDEIFSRVSPGVTLIKMMAANGTVLDLHPVHFRGVSLIALALPHGLRIVQADAYAGSVEVRYAIPFFYQGSNYFEAWLHTSQSPPKSVSAQVPMVLAGSTRSQVSVHIGPWGTCEDVLVPGGFDQGCSPSTHTSKLARFDMGSGASVIGVTRGDVAYFELAMSDGSTVRVPVVHLRGIGYYAIGHATNPKVMSWTAYDAVGIELGGGHGVPGAPHIPNHS